MSLLPLELQKLPPQALDVIRYLNTREDAASVEQILDGTGLSERSFGKAIRRLVTRYYVDMPEQGFYALTANGRQAAEDLRAFDGATPTLARAAAPEPAAAPLQVRQFSVVAQKDLVVRSSAVLRAGFSAPASDQPRLRQPGRIILRVSAPGCDVDPVERPLEVATSAAAGPVTFRVTPRREGSVRIKIEAYQLVTRQDLVPVGGMYFDRTVAEFPTPGSAEIQALGATLRLHLGAEG